MQDPLDIQHACCFHASICPFKGLTSTCMAIMPPAGLWFVMEKIRLQAALSADAQPNLSRRQQALWSCNKERQLPAPN